MGMGRPRFVRLRFNSPTVQQIYGLGSKKKVEAPDTTAVGGRSQYQTFCAELDILLGC